MFENDKYADPRTKDWFLISSPLPLVTILSGYIYFCTRAGPRFMEGREPYRLRTLLVLYNAFQVLFSCYITYEGLVVWSTYNWFCEPIDYSDTPLLKRGLNVCYWYFIAKLTELLDTVLFVLRKKYNQVTFLHLFHHTYMPMLSWFGIRYVAGGHGTLFGVINSFVHIFMYSYYLIAALGPRYQKHLWWKRHLTELQLIQFAVIFLHNIFPLFSSCTYPKAFHINSIVFSSFFTYLFGNFYIKTYLKKSPKYCDGHEKHN